MRRGDAGWQLAAVEQPFAGNRDPEVEARGDVEVFKGGVRYTFDVATTVPQSVGAARNLPQEGAASRASYRRKMGKYWRLMHPDEPMPTGAVPPGVRPMVIERSGRVYWESREALRKLFEGKGDALRNLYRDFSYVAAFVTGLALSGTYAGRPAPLPV